ncbi:bifunctional metallophosphatase/5'-nucleotidase [Cohnella fermenti]|uniref:Bifunctional metallophosphatase/5'-nucleotidase n=1 Tax=Cohnella fermenti TaxID=2565925 RepID=A0A4S4C946_9BACL|nr:bifunctional metallophosphatase/5'-nucleotidase [Cohnella fermenti]
MVHTNDIHSHFEEACRVTGFVKRMREKVPADSLLLLDCGDFLDRARMETEGTEGAANRALLDYMGYDAAAMGNNEGLSYTKEQLAGLFADAPCPVLCANLVDADTGAPPEWMKPYTIVDRAGIRIALLGLTAPYESFYELLGWKTADPLETARRYVPELKRQADLVVILSHLGIRQDELMATSIEGIGLILGAHTHHLLEAPLRFGETVVCAAGKFARHVGVVTIRKELRSGRLTIEGGAGPTDNCPTDPLAEQLVGEYRKRSEAAMSGTVATLREPLELSWEQESPLGTLLAATVRKATGARIGLVNSGQLLRGFPVGAVTRLDLHSACPSPINACRILLSGAHIREALEESLLPEFIGFEFHGFGFRGDRLGTLSVDGIEWTVDETKPPRERVVSAFVGGEPLADEAEYEVGTLDMFTFGIGYLSLKEGRVEKYYLPEFLRDLLVPALRDEAMLRDCRRPRRLRASVQEGSWDGATLRRND